MRDFLKLSAGYETEQKELTEKVKAEQQEVDTYEQNKNDFDCFAAIIRKYRIIFLQIILLFQNQQNFCDIDSTIKSLILYGLYS